MTLLAPAYLGAGLAAAAAVVALHFLARRQPRPRSLPTARFVPVSASRASSLTRLPSDLVLLVMRVIVVVAAGLALARPVETPRRRQLARVVVVDRSGSPADRGAGAPTTEERSAQPPILLLPGDTVIELRGPARGSLSEGLARAVRAAGRLRSRADSLELVIVSALTRDHWDAATAAIRAQWNGRATVIRVPGLIPRPNAVELETRANDPLRATLDLLGIAGAARATTAVRVIRDRASTASDSAFASSGGALVIWPRRATAGDSIDAVYAGLALSAGPFPRTEVALPAGARPVAWSGDGSPVAHEVELGRGCVRVVRFDVPDRGDVALRAAFRRVARALLAPCGGPLDTTPLDSARIAILTGSGGLRPGGVAAAGTGAGGGQLIALLLALSAVALGAEWWWRGRSGEGRAE